MCMCKHVHATPTANWRPVCDDRVCGIMMMGVSNTRNRVVIVPYEMIEFVVFRLCDMIQVMIMQRGYI